MARRFLASVILLAGACNGGDDEDRQSVDEYACYHIAEGTVVDAYPTREEAREIATGLDPYRINVPSATVGYVSFTTGGPADLVALMDFPVAIPAVWNGQERVEIPPGEADPYCDIDILEVDRFSVPGGDHWLEVGPIFQGNVWLMLAPE